MTRCTRWTIRALLLAIGMAMCYQTAYLVYFFWQFRLKGLIEPIIGSGCVAIASLSYLTWDLCTTRRSGRHGVSGGTVHDARLDDKIT